MRSDSHWIKSPPTSSLLLPSPLPPWARFSLVNCDFQGAVPRSSLTAYSLPGLPTA